MASAHNLAGPAPRLVLNDEHRGRFIERFGQWPGDGVVRGLLAIMTTNQQITFVHCVLGDLGTFALRQRFKMQTNTAGFARGMACQIVETFMEEWSQMPG